MELGSNAGTVLERRYLTKDENGNIIETPEELFWRVAAAVAESDRVFGAKNVKNTAREFFEAMTSLRFLPNSPTLMNAGKPLGQLSACFVLPVGDSMPEIFNTVKSAALIHKSGGGTGFSFSRLRPSGSAVRSTGGVASGPVSFMKVFNAATEAVKQGGTRRGANMGILRVDHPDILSFIDCKRDDNTITNFNISVGVTEAFMQAVEAGCDYELRNPHNGREVVSKLNAREVFDHIVEMAWGNGEPGIIFLDRLNRDNVVPGEGEIESTNPCGEQPLLPYESCNLGSINLARMVKAHNGGYAVDYDALGGIVDTAVHFLDNVIQANKYPLDEIETATKKTRKIGLGVMGFADMLYHLGIPYNSREGLDTAEELMRFINERAHKQSQNLARERGAFPLFDQSTYKNELPLRNATCTTIAPTGTISILCDASSGVEPLFALAFVRNVMDRDALPQVNEYFRQTAIARGFYSDELMKRILREGTLAHTDEVPADIRRVFVTAHDISPEYHIRMQAAFQKYTDNAVSKTVNFPHSATKEDVTQVYMLAYKLGCKGVTIYRDGSRSEQVLTVGHKRERGYAKSTRIAPRPRPDVTQGITEKVVIGCGNLYITVNYDESGICEVFTNLGRAGGCPSQSEATSRLVSTALRAGLDVDAIIEQLKGIRCHSTLRQRASNSNIKVLSCPDAIGRVLEKVKKLRMDGAMISQNSQVATCEAEEPVSAPEELLREDNALSLSEEDIAADNPCPECGGEMDHDGGCVVCRGCGYSKCG
ncbi:MAG: vitamin B12-dependent ribonucleotide reductase [Clostridiales bacterium]|nr:vitamin B12-dependent ribonucleotide reductase [Clostridiales bacterium]